MLGIINLYKPTGKTSHDMVSFVRRTLGLKRVGHAGTLDPEASGILPILVGKATVLSDLLTEKTKTYVATVQLGIETDTYDLAGTVTRRSDVRPAQAEIEMAVKGFLGEISQLPPMYSAVKMNGKKLYELARQGLEIERKPRKVFIEHLRCFNFTEDSFNMEVRCSKGTYIRSLCYDIGKSLGTCAVMASLVRTQSGPFLLENAVTPEQLEEAVKAGKTEEVLLPPEIVLSAYRAVTVPAQAVAKIKNGLRMRPKQLGIQEAVMDEFFRLYDGKELLCLSKVIDSEEGPVLAIQKTFYEV